jgi:RNA polymerase sigma factor (sigma-70 family)
MSEATSPIADSSVPELYNRNKDRLMHYLRRRLRSEADVHDLAQEAFLRLIRVERRLIIRNPQAYLFRIASNLVHELYASHDIEVDNAVDVDTVDTSASSTEDIAERAFQCREIERVVMELSPKCRAVFLMHSKLGLTQQEIAEELKLSRSMVQKYQAKALLHCRKRLRRFKHTPRGEQR